MTDTYTSSLLTDEEWADEVAIKIWEAASIQPPAARSVGRISGVGWIVSAVNHPLMNGVLAPARRINPDTLEVALDHVRVHTPNYRVDVRESAVDDVSELFGPEFRVETGTPAMLLDDEDVLAALRAGGDYGTRLLGPGQGEVFADISSEVFRMPRDLVARTWPETWLDSRTDLTRRVMYIDGRPAGVAMAVLSDESVGIYTVCVLEEFRGLGIGRNLSSACIVDGLERGARWAYLQSSPQGFPVYRSIGFRTVDRWTTWIKSDDGAARH